MKITKISHKTSIITRIITCAVFKPAMEHLQLDYRYPHLRSTYLPSNLHLRPQYLKERLNKKIASAQKRNEKIICLYGNCFPGIEVFCQQHGAIKVPGHYCYEMLLGSERFRQLIEEIAGTYFLEKDLILNFEEYCIKPLELHDEEMRKCCFEHYQRLLYVRQPSDPDLAPRASEIAEFLSLFLETSDADYSSLEKKLIEII
ncbi:MAG TPA: DUF1638 domain-containing protein [Dehalococcoidia bacterium]|nr:DUF1638 domain-containing protein [Dehalococcoidia bacterium]